MNFQIKHKGQLCLDVAWLVCLFLVFAIVSASLFWFIGTVIAAQVVRFIVDKLKVINKL